MGIIDRAQAPSGRRAFHQTLNSESSDVSQSLDRPGSRRPTTTTGPGAGVPLGLEELLSLSEVNVCFFLAHIVTIGCGPQ